MQPRFSTGTDEAKAAQDVKPLLSTEGGRWTLAADGQALERSFKFKTFGKTWVCYFWCTNVANDLQVNKLLTRLGFHDGCLTAVQTQESPSRMV